MKYRHTVAAAIGLSMLVFGLSQIQKPKPWENYIPDRLDAFLPTNKSSTMRIHGSGNTLLGLALLTNTYPNLMRPVAGLWWIWVSLFCGRFDWRVGIRDSVVGVILLCMPHENTK
jgi:uncharacterized membrane protein